MPDSDELDQQIKDRKKFTNIILSSKSDKKIIVAGAGTGKSFTFQSLLTLIGDSNSLGLTFINNLAIDLSNDLAGLAEVHTFHGYCKGVLHKISSDGINSHFIYFPKLPSIINIDASILDDHLRDFEGALQRLEDDERIKFFIKRANYYNAVGHNDSVYRVVKCFTSNPDSIPKFPQIVVDEYQDFNPLEVELINLLSLKSPVLIAGDDDQAIYAFKNASPKHIRDKANSHEFELFELSFCSRCTQVIVSSVINITKNAAKFGFLKDRISKQYICFLPDKGDDSKIYPQITHASCSIQNKSKSRNYIGKYIESEIAKISEAEIKLASEKNYPCVLILGPTQYLKQIYSYLKDAFPNVDYVERKDEELEFIDGYKLLMLDENSNLGWRIIIHFFGQSFEEKLIKDTNENDTNIFDLLDRDFIEPHLNIARTLKKLVNEEELTEAESNQVELVTGSTISDIKLMLKPNEEESHSINNPDSLTIKLTTINGSKGMSGGFVFIVGMNNGDLPRNPRSPSDQEICQLIVALTRTRKHCYLISNQRFGVNYGIKQSNLISLIGAENLLDVKVDAEYFKQAK